jgi:hypothetical protein
MEQDQWDKDPELEEEWGIVHRAKLEQTRPGFLPETDRTAWAASGILQ